MEDIGAAWTSTADMIGITYCGIRKIAYNRCVTVEPAHAMDTAYCSTHPATAKYTASPAAARIMEETINNTIHEPGELANTIPFLAASPRV